MKILYDMIHKRSIDTWNGPIIKDNFKLFAEHWIKTAEQIRDEFTNENLNDTAKEMQKIIDIQKRFK